MRILTSASLSPGRLGVDGRTREERLKASVLMLRLSYPTETVLSNKIARNRIVLSFKDSPRIGKHLSKLPEVLKNEPHRTST